MLLRRLGLDHESAAKERDTYNRLCCDDLDAVVNALDQSGS